MCNPNTSLIEVLYCISIVYTQLISDPQNYQAAGRELLEWCSDPRAFTPNFEPHLLECLTVSDIYFLGVLIILYNMQ